MEAKLFDLVGPQLTAMGHSLRRGDGSQMGGYQAIHFTPDPTAQVGGDDPAVAGVFRGGHGLPQGRCGGGAAGGQPPAAAGSARIEWTVTSSPTSTASVYLPALTLRSACRRTVVRLLLAARLPVA